MQRRLAALLILLAIVCPSAVTASGKRDPKASVRFFSEGDANDNPKMVLPLVANGKTRYFNRMPDITLNDIISFSPFPSDSGGDDYGIVFRLKESAAKRYAALTNLNQGRLMLSEINGRVADAFQIDKQINDGRIVIWKGVRLADVTALDATIPRIGQEGVKKKK